MLIGLLVSLQLSWTSTISWLFSPVATGEHFTYRALFLALEGQHGVHRDQKSVFNENEPNLSTSIKPRGGNQQYRVDFDLINQSGEWSNRHKLSISLCLALLCIQWVHHFLIGQWPTGAINPIINDQIHQAPAGWFEPGRGISLRARFNPSIYMGHLDPSGLKDLRSGEVDSHHHWDHWAIQLFISPFSLGSPAILSLPQLCQIASLLAVTAVLGLLFFLPEAGTDAIRTNGPAK